MEITEAELDQMRERAAAATPGPWVHDSCKEMVTLEDGSEGRAYAVAQDDHEDKTVVMSDWCPGNVICETSDRNQEAYGNVTFIAHAREDVPRLVGEVQRLRQLLAEIRELGRAASPA